MEHAAGNANGEHSQLADGLVPDAAWHIDDHALMDLDGLVVEDHRPFAVDDVIDLVGLGVVVQLGVIDLDVVYFRAPSASSIRGRICPQVSAQGVTSAGSRRRYGVVVTMVYSLRFQSTTDC